MSIATKTGDKGETSLIGGERIKKSDKRIEAYGCVDELNASIGVAISFMEKSERTEILTQIQHDLFTIGAELASLTEKKLEINLPRTTKAHVDFLDDKLQKVESALPKQTTFILPSGTKSSSLLHFARTVCRRAERKVVELQNINPECIKYINRLSDLLFLFARKENTGEEYAVKYKN